MRESITLNPSSLDLVKVFIKPDKSTPLQEDQIITDLIVTLAMHYESYRPHYGKARKLVNQFSISQQETAFEVFAEVAFHSEYISRPELDPSNPPSLRLLK